MYDTLEVVYFWKLAKKAGTFFKRHYFVTRPEVSEADPQRNKSMQKVTEKCPICQVSNIDPEILLSTAISKT